jgi:hypothetical protein
METITVESFEAWLAAYGEASAKNDPQASAELFAAGAAYYETPFAEPMVGKEAIYNYWDEGARNLKDKESDYQIVAIQGNLGVARWQARFTHIESGKRIALDCIFLVEFDRDQKCRLFREWWHSQVIESEGTGTGPAAG